MKSYREWMEVTYNPNMDGPPLDPTTIAGAETQIRTLALNIRSSFLYDPNFKPHAANIQKATNLLDQAANLIGEGALDVRNTPHHNVRNPE